MTVPRRLHVVACSLAGTVLLLVGLTPALAQDSAPEVGWWTSNQLAGVPIGRALLVPPGGSQVAAGADGAVSVAAVRFPAGSGGASYRVDVDLASDTDGFTVIACPVTGPWDAVHGAPLPDAPAWDCELGQATGTVDADAGTIAWDLPGSFVREGTLEAMLLPPDASASFTLTMAAPGEGAVAPLAAPSTTTTAPPPSTTAEPPRADDAATAPAATSPSTGSIASGATVGPAPSPTAPVGLPSPLPTAPAAARPDAEVVAAANEDPASTSGRVLGGLVLAAVLAGAALLSRRGSAIEAGGGDGRGVGRFVRSRSEPPVPI